MMAKGGSTRTMRLRENCTTPRTEPSRAERAWMKKTFGKVRGNSSKMTARQMQELSEVMFDAARVPGRSSSVLSGVQQVRVQGVQMNTDELVLRLRSTAGIKMAPPEELSDELIAVAPPDLVSFWGHCGKVELFVREPFGIELVGPSEFVPINAFLYPDPDDPIWEELSDDRSSSWHLLAKASTQSQCISIDTDRSRHGWCYDSFLETHANPGDSAIVARSFTEFVERALRSAGRSWYWTDPAFRPYGDAYD
jgi:hypothetical protein